ncbi:hypothetical protein ACFWGD_08590 [Corynebacterium sp. NPDC060344]|uniref:hypothetical protein n=1 Tax=Corynebacterium sp. NPDC060344 TaxID=3347101 RepID=UPI003664F44D
MKTLRGISRNDRQKLERRCRGGELHRLHPNTYIAMADWDQMDQTERRRLHHLSSVDGRPGMVIVGRSAALVHGLEVVDVIESATSGMVPRWPVPPGEDVVELAHPLRRRIETRGNIHESRFRWDAGEVDLVDGRPVTSIGATVADITHRHGFGQGLVAADSALRQQHSAIDLMRPAALAPQSADALTTVACASQFPDSAAESLMRAQIIEAGLPAPEMQLRVFTGDRIYIGKVDLSYPGLLLMIEVHGKHKFSGRYGDGEARSMYEWRRETEMVQEGLAVLRVTYPQIVSGEALRMVIAALERQRAAVANGAESTALFVPAGVRWPEGYRLRER